MASHALPVLPNRTAYLDDRPRLVTSRAAIAAHSAKGWLLLDVLATLPWDAIVVAATPSLGVMTARTIVLARALRLLKMFRLLRLLRLGRISGRLNAVGSRCTRAGGRMWRE